MGFLSVVMSGTIAKRGTGEEADGWSESNRRSPPRDRYRCRRAPEPGSKSPRPGCSQTRPGTTSSGTPGRQSRPIPCPFEQGPPRHHRAQPAEEFRNRLAGQRPEHALKVEARERVLGRQFLYRAGSIDAAHDEIEGPAEPAVVRLGGRGAHGRTIVRRSSLARTARALFPVLARSILPVASVTTVEELRPDGILPHVRPHDPHARDTIATVGLESCNGHIPGVPTEGLRQEGMS